MADMVSKVKASAGGTLAGILEELRLLAYNDISPHGFSLSSPNVLQRLRTLERLWVHGAQRTETDEAFWNACYERHQRPGNFTAREVYLALAAKGEIIKLAAEAEVRMDEAAERAKTDAEKSNDAVLTAMEELDAMGLELSDQDLADELEKAMMEDWDYEAVQAASPPRAQDSHFKRPPLSACTSKKRRAALQLGREPKRHHREQAPAFISSTTTRSERTTRSMAKSRTRKAQAVPTFTLALRPKPKASPKSSGIGSRKPAGT